MRDREPSAPVACGLLAERWERLHAATLARAAMDLLDHDDLDIQAIGVDLKCISDDMQEVIANGGR